MYWRDLQKNVPKVAQKMEKHNKNTEFNIFPLSVFIEVQVLLGVFISSQKCSDSLEAGHLNVDAEISINPFVFHSVETL